GLSFLVRDRFEAGQRFQGEIQPTLEIAESPVDVSERQLDDGFAPSVFGRLEPHKRFECQAQRMLAAVSYVVCVWRVLARGGGPPAVFEFLGVGEALAR